MNITRLFVLILINNFICGFLNHYSQTYLQTRPCYANLTTQSNFWNELAFEKDCNKSGHFQFITFYQNSVDNCAEDKGSELAQYFLMKHRNELTVYGDGLGTQLKVDRDIRAEWIGLPSDFKGTFSVFPTQEQTAACIEFKKDFRTDGNSFFDNFWAGVAIYMQTIQNNLNVSQTRSSAVPSSQPKTIIEALNNGEFTAGKFRPGESASIGLSEIRLKIGKMFDCKNKLQISLGSFALLPLSHKPIPTNMFTAMRGYTGHPGFGSLIGFQFPINDRCSNYVLSFFAKGENIFFFKSSEIRVLDLMNKPWSRFLLLNRSDGVTNLPAINILKQKVHVHPYNFVDIAAGFKVQHNSFVAQLSFALWAHASERIKLANKWTKDYGIAAPDGSALTPNGIAPTASSSTIKTQADVDVKKDINDNVVTKFIHIESNELDLNSGAARAAMTSKIDLALGLIKNGKKCNVAFGFGAFFEIPNNNSALKNWGFWSKVAASF